MSVGELSTLHFIGILFAIPFVIAGYFILLMVLFFITGFILKTLLDGLDWLLGKFIQTKPDL